MKFLDSFAYFSFSFVFTMFISSDFGYTDMQARAIYGLWGALITIYGLLSGFIINNVATQIREFKRLQCLEIKIQIVTIEVQHLGNGINN